MAFAGLLFSDASLTLAGPRDHPWELSCPVFWIHTVCMISALHPLLPSVCWQLPDLDLSPGLQASVHGFSPCFLLCPPSSTYQGRASFLVFGAKSLELPLTFSYATHSICQEILWICIPIDYTMVISFYYYLDYFSSLPLLFTNISANTSLCLFLDILLPFLHMTAKMILT